MSAEKKSNPYVSREFCDERFKRIVEKIDSIKQTVKIVGLTTTLLIAVFELILRVV